MAIEILSSHIQFTLLCDCGHQWDYEDSDSNSIEGAELKFDEECPKCSIDKD